MITHNKERETFAKILIVLIPGEEICVMFFFFSVICIIIPNAFWCFPNVLPSTFTILTSVGGKIQQKVNASVNTVIFLSTLPYLKL